MCIRDRSSDAEEHEENSEKVKKKRDGLLQKIQTFIKKIKCTIQGLCDKIKLLTEKKDKLTQFVQDETHILSLIHIYVLM